MTYPNDALTEVCRLLMDDFGLTLEQVRHLAADIYREFESLEVRRVQKMESAE